MTPEDVRNVRFNPAGSGKRGYDEDEVDRFLDLIEETLRGLGELTPEDIRNVSFGKPRRGKPGYDADEVDSFLDQAEAALRARYDDPFQGAARPEPTRLRSGAVLRAEACALPLAGPGSGYLRSAVDEFMERAANALDGRARMSSREVRGTAFPKPSLLARGYRANAVNALMEVLAQELSSRGK